MAQLGLRPGHTLAERVAAEVAWRNSSGAAASGSKVPMKAMKADSRATRRDLTKKIAESTQLKTKKVKDVFAALRTIAYAEVKKTKKFVIPKLLTLELKHKPARKAGTKVMFGREVKVAAKPASKVVRALPAKALKDSI